MSVVGPGGGGVSVVGPDDGKYLWLDSVKVACQLFVRVAEVCLLFDRVELACQLLVLVVA